MGKSWEDVFKSQPKEKTQHDFFPYVSLGGQSYLVAVLVGGKSRCTQVDRDTASSKTLKLNICKDYGFKTKIHIGTWISVVDMLETLGLILLFPEMKIRNIIGQDLGPLSTILSFSWHYFNGACWFSSSSLLVTSTS